MTTAYITFMGLYHPAVTIGEANGEKEPIAELYHTDNKLYLLLWRKPNEGGWRRKTYKHSESAEKALIARTAEYVEYFCGKNYELHNRIADL